jgi:hypothetical protein
MTGQRQIDSLGSDAGERKVPGRKWDFAVGPQKEVPVMHRACRAHAREDRNAQKWPIAELGKPAFA